MEKRIKILLCIGSIAVSIGILKMVDITVGYFYQKGARESRTSLGIMYKTFLDKDWKYIKRFKGLQDEDIYFRNKYLSYAVWGYYDKKGIYVNIENGFRKTYSPPHKEGVYQKTIWFFGGSAMLGQGSPDDYTIPSYVSKILARKMPNIFWKCENYGIGGYVNFQEIILFIKLIQKKKIENSMELPDFIIFYDGVNDYIAATQGYPLEHHNFTEIKSIFENRLDNDTAKLLLHTAVLITKRIREFFPNISAVLKINKKDISAGEPDLRPLLKESALAYNFNYNLCKEISEEGEFKIYFIFQPTIFKKLNLSEYELSHTNRSSGSCTLWEYFYNSIKELDFEEGKNITFLDFTKILDDIKNTVFYCWGDWMHTNWLGNRIIANKIAEIIKADILKDKKSIN